MSAALAQLASIRAGSLTPVFGLLVDTALKGSLLILAAAIAAYLLRGKSAAARHAAWSAAVAGHLALPFLTLLVPQWRLPILPAPPWLDTPVVSASVQQPHGRTGGVAITPEATSGGAPTRNVSAVTGNGPVGSRPSAGTTTPNEAAGINSPKAALTGVAAGWPLISVFGLLWILGATLVLLRLAIGTWRVGHLAKSGDRVDDGDWLSLAQRIAKGLGITRPLILLRGGSLAVPVTWGVVYPAVLLPPDSREWPEARRRVVLVHEMAHIRRFDALTQLVAQMTIAIMWFDPLIWLAAHRMRVEREHACDDYVLRDGTTPSLYAGELLGMVQSIGLPRHQSAAPAFAALAMARRSEFEGRMLAILDPRQNRRTLGRTSTVVASVALALMVIPLAALRPFRTTAESKASVTASLPAMDLAASPNAAAPFAPTISDASCDSVARAGNTSTSTHIHVNEPEDVDRRIIEFLATSPGRCAQAVVFGKAAFANDRLIALSPGSFASFRERTPSGDRMVRVLPRDGGLLEFIPSIDGRRVGYDDEMRGWLARFVPEVLREAAIDVPERVARDLGRGGVPLVLAHIGQTRSLASRRRHYEALLRGKPLTEAEYSDVTRHATRTLSDNAADLSAVLSSIAASPAKGTRTPGGAVQRRANEQQAMGIALGSALARSSSSTDSASTLTQYASTDDPAMILMALRGAKEISSDTDRRILLQTMAPRALRRGNAALRNAFFDAVSALTSDTDLRVTLTDALPYGHADPAVTLAVFRTVASKMTSDTDKRLTLTIAAEQNLLSTPELRAAFMTAAKTIQSSTDYTGVMRAALKQ